MSYGRSRYEPSSIVAVFQIPMRGNEHVIRRPEQHCHHDEFQIPMRGNEIVMAATCFRSLATNPVFQIPMRGNESSKGRLCRARYVDSDAFQIPMRGNERARDLPSTPVQSHARW